MKWILLAALALLANSCASLDKEGKKPVATIEVAVPEYTARKAVMDVFGKRGFKAFAPAANPMRLESPATPRENIAYKDFAMFDTEIINRAYLDFTPTATGTRIVARAQVVGRPDTMFEDAKFPLLGTRNRYKRLLEEVASSVSGSTDPLAPAFDAPVPPMQSGSSYQVPLPLETTF